MMALALANCLELFNQNDAKMTLPPNTQIYMVQRLQQLHNLLEYRTIRGFMEHGLHKIDRIQEWIDMIQPSNEKSGSTPSTSKGVSVSAVAPATPTSTATSTPAPTSEIATDNSILQLLQKHKIPFEHYAHAKCQTADELVEHVPIPDTETHTKNLFLRDKKHGLFLVTLAPSTNFNTKDLGKLLQLSGKVNLRMADAALLDEVLHVQPGCVGPLDMGIATPTDDMPVVLVVDNKLLEYDQIHSHPLYNDQSVKMTPKAFKDFFGQINVEPKYIDFSTVSSTTVSESNAPKEKKEKAAQNKKQSKKGETLLALQWKKNENFPMWYSDVIVLSEMISYYDISGCYVLRPWSYKMWELVQQFFNERLATDEVENCYFPLFVSQDRLEKEKDHVEGFAPEVAWVTKSGDGELAKPIAIRPTSETIMYPAYADWIRSHRDLPLKLNQWSNVVRWEFKYPTPFLRTREFLWQEGHTAHSSFNECEAMVLRALEWYRAVYEDLLAVPVVPGFKTEKEKFAGGFRTTTVEAYIAGSGRAIQGATSHNLGQNFGKMFDIKYQDEKGQTQIPWQCSFGLTTRTLGVMVMVHGDDTGLSLPPRIAPLQVVIVPIYGKNFPTDQADPYCNSVLEVLKKADIRAKFDDRNSYNPGWKYNHWEQKGVPVRLEVGPRDLENKSVRVVVRHDGEKIDKEIDDLGEWLKNKLEEIQVAMFEKAKSARDSHIVQVTEWKDFVPELEKNNLVLTPWCGGDNTEWEEKVKEMSREESLQARGEEAEDEKTATSVAAKTLCIPFKQPELPAGTKCFASGLDATCWILWGRSY